MASGGELQLQAYVDRSNRDDALFYRPTAEIVDLDFQYALPGDEAPGAVGRRISLGTR